MRALGYFKSKSFDDVGKNEIKSIFHNYCELNLHVPVKLFISDNNSNLNKDLQYLNLIEFIKNENSEYLVVINDVRDFGSDIESVARVFAVFHELKALVKCASEDYPDPIQNAFRVLRPKGVSLTRSVSIKNIMQTKAMEGKVLGRPPYGYENNNDGFLEPVKNEASVVELIFKLYTKDQIGLRLIAQHLNDRQLTTRKGSNWSMVGIRDVLKNPVYLALIRVTVFRDLNRTNQLFPLKCLGWRRNKLLSGNQWVELLMRSHLCFQACYIVLVVIIR